MLRASIAPKWVKTITKTLMDFWIAPGRVPGRVWPSRVHRRGRGKAPAQAGFRIRTEPSRPRPPLCPSCIGHHARLPDADPDLPRRPRCGGRPCCVARLFQDKWVLPEVCCQCQGSLDLTWRCSRGCLLARGSRAIEAAVRREAAETGCV